jgi:hypothetical protein
MTEEMRRLESELTEESHARIRAYARGLLDLITLNELREAREMTHATLMKTLQLGPSEASQIEYRTDLYFRTFAGYVEAQGGQLEICAVFPHGTIKIDQFSDLAKMSANQ